MTLSVDFFFAYSNMKGWFRTGHRASFQVSLSVIYQI